MWKEIEIEREREREREREPARQGLVAPGGAGGAPNSAEPAVQCQRDAVIIPLYFFMPLQRNIKKYNPLSFMASEGTRGITCSEEPNSAERACRAGRFNNPLAFLYIFIRKH